MKTTPHLESMLPYGYTFNGIDVIVGKMSDEDVEEALGRENTTHFHLGIKKDENLREKVTFEIASHIEGNFGCPYEATLVWRENGDAYQLFVVVVEEGEENYSWWDTKHCLLFSNYIMGLRAGIGV